MGWVEGEWVEGKPCEDAPACGCCPSDPEDTGMSKDDYLELMMSEDYYDFDMP